MSYTEIGQVARVQRWDDGELDAPALVLVSCDRCGVVVAPGATEIHDASHA